jgi:hypothetical protein
MRKLCKDCGKKLDGTHKTYCKKCFNVRWLIYRDKNITKRREADKLRHRLKRLNHKGYKTLEYRKYRKNNPEAVKAQAVLNRYIKTGKIKRSSCEVCGASKNIHGHHPDYSKPLEVIWLCPVCHKKVNRIKIKK